MRNYAKKCEGCGGEDCVCCEVYQEEMASARYESEQDFDDMDNHFDQMAFDLCEEAEERKEEMLEEIKASSSKYITYGDGDLGIPVLREKAIEDIENMEADSIGLGTWYECDENGKEI